MTLKIKSRPEQPENIRKILEHTEKVMGTIPKPLQMMTISPDIFNLSFKSIQYFSSHKTLSSELLLFLRYLTAKKMNYQPCIEFNGQVLNRMGITENELEIINSTPESIPLPEAEKKLLQFVLEKLTSNETVKSEEIDRLKNFGWQDKDIFDALYHAFSMMVPAKIIKLFNSFE